MHWPFKGGNFVNNQGQLANCIRCGKLILKTRSNVCGECFSQVEEEYDKVRKFLRKEHNRYATINETSASTGVAAGQILRFIHEGRILLHDLPNFKSSIPYIRMPDLDNEQEHQSREIKYNPKIDGKYKPIQYQRLKSKK
jgi:hypothetical protein